MKKGFSIISVLLVVLFLLSGCSPQQPQDDLENYNRVGSEGFITHINYPKDPKNWEQIYAEADLVAIVEVQYVEAFFYQEISMGSTIFRASVRKIYKNEINYKEDSLLLLQCGEPRVTIDGFPLFKAGDVFLLGLKVGTDPVGFSEPVFYPVEHERVIYQVFEYEGVEYVLFRNSRKSLPETIVACDVALGEKIWVAVHESDPLLLGGPALKGYVYLLDDVEQYMEELKQ